MTDESKAPPEEKLELLDEDGRIRLNEDGSITISLLYPVKYGKERDGGDDVVHRELAFRKPIAKDMRKYPTVMKVGDFLDIGGRLCLQPPSFMDRLELPDVTQVVQAISFFIVRGPQTGRTS